jgi:hypothetical protein
VTATPLSQQLHTIRWGATQRVLAELVSTHAFYSSATSQHHFQVAAVPIAAPVLYSTPAPPCVAKSAGQVAMTAAGHGFSEANSMCAGPCPCRWIPAVCGAATSAGATRRMQLLGWWRCTSSTSQTSGELRQLPGVAFLCYEGGKILLAGYRQQPSGLDCRRPTAARCCMQGCLVMLRFGRCDRGPAWQIIKQRLSVTSLHRYYTSGYPGYPSNAAGG